MKKKNGKDGASKFSASLRDKLTIALVRVTPELTDDLVYLGHLLVVVGHDCAERMGNRCQSNVCNARPAAYHIKIENCDYNAKNLLVERLVIFVEIAVG